MFFFFLKCICTCFALVALPSCALYTRILIVTPSRALLLYTKLYIYYIPTTTTTTVHTLPSFLQGVRGGSLLQLHSSSSSTTTTLFIPKGVYVLYRCCRALSAIYTYIYVYIVGSSSSSSCPNDPAIRDCYTPSYILWQ